MSQKISKTITYLSIVIIVIGSIFLANGLILAWTPPSASPPDNNVSSPLNVGGTSQYKSGALGIEGAFRAYGDIKFDNYDGCSALETDADGDLVCGTDSGALCSDCDSRFVNTSGDSITDLTFNRLLPTTGDSPNSGYSHYAIYEEPGTWTHPYPDLMIEYHTGIKYIAYYGYGGHRFYTGYNADASPNTLAFSIGDGDHNVRVSNNLYVGGNVTVGAQVTGGFGAQTTGGTKDWNDISNIRSGSGYTLLLGNAGNGPGPGTYFHPFNFEYSSKDGSGNMTQLAIPYGATSHMNAGMFMRGRYSGTWSPWMKILSEDSSGNVSGISGNHNSMLHSTMFLQGSHHSRHLGCLLSDGNIDAD